MRENCDVLCLPDELLLFIVERLIGKDVICFSLACRRFSKICQMLRKISLENCWNTGITIENLKVYLSVSVDPLLITKCNFNNCYWLPAVLLQNFIKKCANMDVLHISETKLNCGHLAHIFLKCRKIRELSLNISQNDLKINSKDTKNFEDAMKHSCLNGCQGNLKILEKLEITFLFTSLQEMALFVSFCESLKELILVPVESKEQDMHMNSRFDEMRNPATIKGKFILDSLIVVNLKEDDGVAQAHRRYQEYLVFQTNMKELTNHWNDASPCPVTTKKYISLTFKHLRKPRGMFEIWWAQQNAPFAWNMMEDELAVDGWYLNDPLETLDLTHVRSLRESVPVFIGKRLKASQAKLVSCFYSNQGFSDFCQSHRHVELLKLKAPPILDDWGNVLAVSKIQVGEEWHSNSWEHLTKLQALSMEPSLLAVVNKLERVTTRKRKFHELRFAESNSVTTSHSMSIGVIVQNCSRIEELEICIFKENITDTNCRIDGEDLAHIAQCKLLKKLTLGNFYIMDGVFLEEILQGCSLLESLRLKNLGSPLLCCFTKNLSSSLHHAKKLNTLSIFQRNIVPLGKLLDTVEQCTSLVRLGIVAPSDAVPFKWTADELTRRLLVLCKKLPHLVAFFSVMNIPKSHSVKATKQVQQHMTPERASFCVDIQASDRSRLDHESNSLPLIHREILVHFNSRVGVIPHDYKSSLL